MLACGGEVVLADINIASDEAVTEELGPEAYAVAVDVRSTDSFAAHAPYTPESEKYNVPEVAKRLRSENG